MAKGYAKKDASPSNFLVPFQPQTLLFFPLPFLLLHLIIISCVRVGRVSKNVWISVNAFSGKDSKNSFNSSGVWSLAAYILSLSQIDSIQCIIVLKIFFTHLNHTNPVLDSMSYEYKKIITSGYNILKDKQIFLLIIMWQLILD